MKIRKLSPNFAVSDIRKTVQFYCDVLGFKLVMAVPETQDGIDPVFSEQKQYVYAVVANEDVELMFEHTDTFMQDIPLPHPENIGASVSFYMEVEEIEALYKEIRRKNVATTELKTTWYGMREFYLQDNNGYILGFAEKAE
ncbi:bleomycin resistance family protein [Betaproteobacteria bacterium]|nr:bleomycin resistance family protein [Betaproteobacteria bacterium]